MNKEEFKENSLELNEITETNELIYKDYDKECEEFFSESNKNKNLIDSSDKKDEIKEDENSRKIKENEKGKFIINF